MTPESQRIALAEWMGWTMINATGLHPVGMDPNIDGPAIAKVQRLPDTNDLNVLMEIARKLPEDKHAEYVSRLANLCLRVPPREPLVDYRYWFRVCTADAPKVSEALCRTLELWKD